MLNVSKSISLNASFNDQRAFNKELKYYAVLSEKTHEKSLIFDDKKINFLCFFKYFLHLVATRLSVLINVIHILNSFAFNGEAFINVDVNIDINSDVNVDINALKVTTIII